MRSRQIGFALVTAFVLVSALYTGEALYYYALCVMAGILLISVVSLAFISIQFNYLQALSPAVEKLRAMSPAWAAMRHMGML